MSATGICERERVSVVCEREGSCGVGGVRERERRGVFARGRGRVRVSATGVGERERRGKLRRFRGRGEGSCGVGGGEARETERGTVSVRSGRFERFIENLN